MIERSSVSRHAGSLAGFIAGVAMLGCTGCSGVRAYAHKSFATSMSALRCLFVLPPQVRIREAGLLTFGQPIPQESQLQTVVRDEAERTLRSRGYDIPQLGSQTDLAVSSQALLRQFDDMLEHVQPMEFPEGKSRYFGEEVRRIGVATNSDALVLISCRGNHWQRSPGPQGAVRETLRYLAVVFAPPRWHPSQVFLKVMVVRTSDGLLLWYGDNLHDPGLNITNDAQLRERIRLLFEQFPKR